MRHYADQFDHFNWGSESAEHVAAKQGKQSAFNKHPQTQNRPRKDWSVNRRGSQQQNDSGLRSHISFLGQLENVWSRNTKHGGAGAGTDSSDKTRGVSEQTPPTR